MVLASACLTVAAAGGWVKQLWRPLYRMEWRVRAGRRGKPARGSSRSRPCRGAAAETGGHRPFCGHLSGEYRHSTLRKIHYSLLQHRASISLDPFSLSQAGVHRNRVLCTRIQMCCRNATAVITRTWGAAGRTSLCTQVDACSFVCLLAAQARRRSVEGGHTVPCLSPWNHRPLLQPPLLTKLPGHVLR